MNEPVEDEQLGEDEQLATDEVENDLGRYRGSVDDDLEFDVVQGRVVLDVEWTEERSEEEKQEIRDHYYLRSK